MCANSDELTNTMNAKYLNSPEYTFEKANRASQACGPLVKWAIAQVSTPLSVNQRYTVEPCYLEHHREIKQCLKQLEFKITNGRFYA
jgi:hypothetical protein